MRIPKTNNGKERAGRHSPQPCVQPQVEDPYAGDPDYIDVTQMSDSTKRYMNIRTAREIITDIPVPITQFRLGEY